MSASDVAPEVAVLSLALYTSINTSLPQNRQLGHISVATGRIPSLFCAIMVLGVTLDWFEYLIG